MKEKTFVFFLVPLCMYFKCMQFYPHFYERSNPIFMVELSLARKWECCMKENGKIVTERGRNFSEKLVTKLHYAPFRLIKR
jgi:hypothetical protein